jgi:ABC-type nitrate/sulfonate/bicarbonate transport system substrate-binding protein
MNTPKRFRRISLVLVFAALAAAPLSARADDATTTVLQWLGLGTTSAPTPPPPTTDAGPGGCPTSGGC